MGRVRVAIRNVCDRLARRFGRRVRMLAWRIVLRPLASADLLSERAHVLDRKPVALHRVHISPKQEALLPLLNERLSVIDVELHRRGLL